MSLIFREKLRILSLGQKNHHSYKKVSHAVFPKAMCLHGTYTLKWLNKYYLNQLKNSIQFTCKLPNQRLSWDWGGGTVVHIDIILYTIHTIRKVSK